MVSDRKVVGLTSGLVVIRRFVLGWMIFCGRANPLGLSRNQHRDQLSLSSFRGRPR